MPDEYEYNSNPETDMRYFSSVALKALFVFVNPFAFEIVYSYLSLHFMRLEISDEQLF